MDKAPKPHTSRYYAFQKCCKSLAPPPFLTPIAEAHAATDHTNISQITPASASVLDKRLESAIRQALSYLSAAVGTACLSLDQMTHSSG
jgi:hypothetical protein